MNMPKQVLYIMDKYGRKSLSKKSWSQKNENEKITEEKIKTMVPQGKQDLRRWRMDEKNEIVAKETPWEAERVREREREWEEGVEEKDKIQKIKTAYHYYA